ILIQNFPEHEDASKTYEKELESWETQLKEYQTELAAMEEEFKQRAMLYSPEKKNEKTTEILNKRKEAVSFYQDIFGPQGKAEQRKYELLTPIYDKVNRAIEILGEREKYTMIFNAQGLLFAKQELDLTEEVLKVLKSGVEISPSSSRGSGSSRR
ncbi:MAG: OmpH family outer membrane protein, partial [Gemmatimonadota bacterium]|nr:OmpH family outer membrane protein [Gemmatimonadota bacterium]